MKYLKIKNDGILDIRLVALMGGTTKSNDEFKIGQFGTGLKYTLAYLIRNNVDFHIFAGKEKVDIKVETETIRDEEFNIICINGHRTSITDRMGKEWSAWMIIRELWCNALDEGGSEKQTTEIVEGYEDSTCFYIQITPEIKDVIMNWTKYFIHEEEPIYSDKFCAIYPGGADLRVYKNGVLIKRVEKEHALFSYDYKAAEINELREYNGSLDYVIFKCLKNADDKTITKFLEGVTDQHFEAKTDLNWYESFSEQWGKTIGEAKIIHPEALKSIESRGLSIDKAATICVPKNVYKALTKQFKGIGALRVADKVNEFYETVSSDSDNKIKQGLVILEEAGYNFSPELKFIYGVFGDKNVWARVNMDEKVVMISENIADKSLFDVVTTLVEENEHFKSGFQDCSRQFQQHFIDLYVNTLLQKSKIVL
nr:hypothetical protein [uncultured Flavobacterium sp.]